jgi:hypothetical protein
MSNPFCVCPGIGFCERYNRRNGCIIEICRGETGSPEKEMAYRRLFLEQSGHDASYIAAELEKLEKVYQAIEHQSLPGPWRKSLATKPPCKYLHDHVGETVQCAQCGKGTKLKVFDCALHGRCTLARPGEGIEYSCATCPDYQPDPSHGGIYVELVQLGLGDVLVGLTIAEGLRWQNPNRPITVICNEKASWVSMFWPLVKPVQGNQEPKLRVGIRPDYIKFWWEQSQRDFKVKPAIPRYTGYELPEAKLYDGYVLISPMGNGGRDWGIDNWLAVERILIEKGVPCAILHGWPEKQLDPFKSKKLIARQPLLVAGAVRHARAVAANDSGIAHLAGILGTPAVAACIRSSNLEGMWPSLHSMGGWSKKPLVPGDVAEVVMAQKPRPEARPVAVVTVWDDKYEALARLTWPALARYAEEMGYVAVRGALDESRPPSWSKIPAILAAMDAGAEVVLWIDADAKVKHSVDVLQMLGDKDVAYARCRNSLFNAGVMVLRRCDWVKQALKAAWAAGKDNPHCDCWEQWHIEREFLKRADRCREVPRQELNSYPGDECKFILHATPYSFTERVKILR